MKQIDTIRAALERGLEVLPTYAKTYAQLAEALTALAELEKAEAVYLVATGETYEGAETYTRHDVAPELCDCEKLYTTTPPAKPAMGMFTAEEAEDFYWLEAWRSELGPTLGLVEIREPSDDECRAIWREAKANEGDGSKICAGRAMFDACRAVMWPKEGL